MNSYAGVFSKNERTVIGILSGTSVDSIDVVLVKINRSGSVPGIKVLDFRSYTISKRLRDYILKCSSRDSGTVENVSKLNFLIGRMFAESVNKTISSNNLKSKDIDLIGSHGQTIFHFPFNKNKFGYNTRSTLQVGDPSVIANLTGVTTIGDFRSADMAVGGEGAPLVPYLDFTLYSSDKSSRALVNIGGIANITYLKKSCSIDEVTAFDTGPGNILIDYLSRKFFGKKFDRDGRFASRGKPDLRLFEHIIKQDKFIKRKPPKSTGREYYGKEFAETALLRFKRISKEDIIATFTKYTAYTIYLGLKKFKPDEVLVSGGGSRNMALMNFLREYLGGVEVKTLNSDGINSHNKEAILFALLANDLASGKMTNITSVTGASRNVYLGKICPA